MTTVKFNFGDLHDAASRANKAARKMDSYADGLPGVVNNPLASLEGGASQYTATAASLASSKQAELRRRASAYRSFSNQTEAFISTAKTVDNNVKGHLARVADARAEGMGWWKKGQYYLYKMFNHAYGSSEAGAIVGNILNIGSYVHTKKMEYLKRIRDWFAHGDGKYVLNIALAALATIGAVVAAILTFPVGSILAAIVAIATIVASVVTIVDSVAKVIGNVKALKMNSTEPGQARYHGNISDLTDYATKETTSKGFQGFAKGFDTTGKIAGAVAFVGKFGLVKNADGKWVTDLSKKNVLKNVGSKFGFDYNATAKHHFSFAPGAPFGLDSKKVSGLEKFNKYMSSTESMLQTFQCEMNWDGKFDGYSDIKNFTKEASSVLPGLKGYDKVLGWGKDVYDLFSGPDSVSKIEPIQYSVHYGGGGFSGR